jgi:prepilin-type N-terminal cleavage/methylation domain-containing protein
MRQNKGFTLIELIIVVAIIGILAAISIPAYIGQQRNAARTEAFKNLEALRLLEEQFFAENAAYTASAGGCAADNDYIAAIQALLPGFQPNPNPSFSYCLELNVNLAGAAAANCFAARAYGNTGSRVAGETFAIDCTNNRDF